MPARFCRVWRPGSKKFVYHATIYGGAQVHLVVSEWETDGKRRIESMVNLSIVFSPFRSLKRSNRIAWP